MRLSSILTGSRLFLKHWAEFQGHHTDWACIRLSLFTSESVSLHDKPCSERRYQLARPGAFCKLTSIEPAERRKSSSGVNGEFTVGSCGNAKIYLHRSEAYSAIVFTVSPPLPRGSRLVAPEPPSFTIGPATNRVLCLQNTL
jgi:hypothetical protein